MIHTPDAWIERQDEEGPPLELDTDHEFICPKCEELSLLSEAGKDGVCVNCSEKAQEDFCPGTPFSNTRDPNFSDTHVWKTIGEADGTIFSKCTQCGLNVER